MATIETETSVTLQLSESEARVILGSLETMCDNDYDFGWSGANAECVRLRDLLGSELEPESYR